MLSEWNYIAENTPLCGSVQRGFIKVWLKIIGFIPILGLPEESIPHQVKPPGAIYPQRRQ
jgi:hypothetical protein